VAQVVAERPVLQQERGDERERHAEHGHEQVADGHVHDEQVGDGVHLGGERDHVAHQPVADQRHREHRRVHQVDDRLEHGGVQRPVVLGVARDVPCGLAAVEVVRFVHGTVSIADATNRTAGGRARAARSLRGSKKKPKTKRRD